MYKLYYSPGACSFAVHAALREVGEDPDLKLVSVMDGEAFGAEHLAVNPKGRVPVLELAGARLTEVPAILAYLAAAHPDAALLPTAPLAAARALEWMTWLASEVHPAFGQIWRPLRSVADPALYAAVQAQGHQNVLARCADIEARLALAGDYALGEAYSAVDPYLLVFFRWGALTGVDMSAYPAWSAQAARVGARPAVAAAVRAERLA